MLLSQEERLFHRDERYPHTHGYVPAPSEEVRLRLTDLGNPTNPLGQVRGNDEARKGLCRAAFTALGRYNHACNDVAFLLTGPKGAHKQEIARRFAELLRLPFIEINPATVRTAHDIFIEMGNALQRAKLPLVECKGPGRYVLPPSVIFLDDCDCLKQKPQVWTALLQAVAITDPALRTEQGVLVKTIHATWLLAITNRADVVDGLPDRFTELALAPVSASASHLASSDLDQKYQAAPRPDLSSLRAKRAELEKRGILGPPTQAWLKESGGVNPPLPSAENLKRWKDSSHSRAWVEAHKGAWNHADWLSLLEELKKSEYWPLDPDSVGQVLEELKRAYQNQRCPPAPSSDQKGQPTGAKVCVNCHINTVIDKRTDFVELRYIWMASCPQCGSQWEYVNDSWVHKGRRTSPAAPREGSSVSRPAAQQTAPPPRPPAPQPRPPTTQQQTGSASPPATRHAPPPPEKSIPVPPPAASQEPTPQTIDPATYPMVFVDVGSSFKLACPCCSKEGHNVVQYEKERKEPGWSFWRGSWACPHCGQKFLLWKCKHCRSCFFTLQDSPGDLACCGLPPARVVGRKAERRWHQWLFNLDANAAALHLIEYGHLHDPNTPVEA